MHRTFRKSGFTLVELLVVIGVIALLIAILLPALNRAAEQSKRVACMSNLRQLGMGAIMYAQESHDWFPVETISPTTNYWKADGLFHDPYKNIVKKQVKSGWVVDDDGGSIYGPDVTTPPGKMGIWLCPSYAGRWRFQFNTITGAWPASYDLCYLYIPRGYYTGLFKGWDVNPDERLRKLKDRDASRKVIFTDTIMYGLSSSTYTSRDYFPWINHAKKGQMITSSKTYPVTVDGANQVFGDGHAEWVTNFPKILNAAAPTSPANNAKGTHAAVSPYFAWFWY